MTSHSHEWQQLWDNLKDTQNRQELATEIATTLAFQIRHLREKAGWTQSELARRTDKEQPTISQLEDPNYGRYSLATLKKIANAFDVALVVRYVAFSELVDWLVNLKPEKLAPPNYSEEQQQYQQQGERRLAIDAFSVTLPMVATSNSSSDLSYGEMLEEKAIERATQSQKEGSLAIAA